MSASIYSCTLPSTVHKQTLYVELLQDGKGQSSLSAECAVLHHSLTSEQMSRSCAGNWLPSSMLMGVIGSGPAGFLTVTYCKTRKTRRKTTITWSTNTQQGQHFKRLAVASDLLVCVCVSGFRWEGQDLGLHLLETEGFAFRQNFLYNLWPAKTQNREGREKWGVSEGSGNIDMKRDRLLEGVDLQRGWLDTINPTKRPFVTTLNPSGWTYLMRPLCDGFGRLDSFRSSLALWREKHTHNTLLDNYACTSVKHNHPGTETQLTSSMLMEDRKALFSLMVSRRFSSYSESSPYPTW